MVLTRNASDKGTDKIGQSKLLSVFNRSNFSLELSLSLVCETGG